MTVYFYNSGLIDLDVIRVMGVSVKETDNPIGFFGTGLKFALATLLRTGHRVTLHRGDESVVFGVRQESIRGKQVGRVYMEDEALAFTTDLGRNWEVWQAYRELHANALDESGVISDRKPSGPRKNVTCFEVVGDGIQREYENRHKIFVEGKPLYADAMIEIYEGETTSIYYRGVKCGTNPAGLKFRYNLLCQMDLTEDRTFKSMWDVEYKLETLLPRITDRGILSVLLGSGEASYDRKLNWTMCGSPSAEFIEVAARRYSDATASQAARSVVERYRQDEGHFPEAALTGEQEHKMDAAFRALPLLDCTLTREEVKVAETLGPGIMGLYHAKTGQVYVAASTLDWGVETVVATLYEEWLHKRHGYADCSRALQNFLFQRLVAVTLGLTPPDPAKKGEREVEIEEVPF